MSDILKDCAEAFNKLSLYNYQFIVGRKKRTIELNFKSLKSEFIHTIGLEHLKDIPAFSSHSLNIKNSAFQNILNGDITLNDISKSSFFTGVFKDTFNNATQTEYTLTDRITLLINIEKILDNAHNGVIYKWDINKAKRANIITPKGQR